MTFQVREVAVIATLNLQPTLAAQAATKSIPIVFAISAATRSR